MDNLDIENETECIKLLIVGEFSTGKNSIIEMFVNNKFQ